MGDVIEIEDALKGLRTALETGFRSALKDVGARLHDHIDEEIQSAGTTPPGVPQNLQLVSVTVSSASRAIATFGWDPVDGADIYQFGHVGPDGSWHRSVLTTTGDEAEVGNRAPFFVTPGAPWTAYVRAGIRVGSSIVWGMPAVLDVQIPPFVTGPDWAHPVARVQGQIVEDAWEGTILIGAPGAKTTAKTFRHISAIGDTGAFEFALDATDVAGLGLPNLGAAQVGGVGGAASGYYTEIDVEFGDGGARFNSPNAVVIDGFGQNLIGLRFAVSRELTVAVDTVEATLAYYARLKTS